MKKILLFIMILVLCGSYSFAQSTDKIAQERAELVKLSKKQLCVVINVLKSVKSDGAAFLME